MMHRHKFSQIHIIMQNQCLKWPNFNYEDNFWKSHVISFMMKHLFLLRNYSYLCIFHEKDITFESWRRPTFAKKNNPTLSSQFQIESPAQFQVVIITATMFTFYISTKNPIECGYCVSGKFGPLVPNSKSVTGNRTCPVRTMSTGTVISANGYCWWNAKCDADGEVRRVSSGTLKRIHGNEGIPLDEVAEQTVSNNFYLVLIELNSLFKWMLCL